MSMYEHIVAFRFHKPIGPEIERGLLEQLHAFKGRIPGIVEVTAGVNMTEEKDNIHDYTLGLRVTFDSLEALRAYGPHPVHQEFVRSLDGILKNVVVIDYPIAT
ncbi:Stress responsive alpha-beta barrel domain-containing protein [Paenibacillus mucilaginosus 3016]|uniref:Stress responsive alpha-beta barrel domain-containing protein n=2 Tax=Paenibacillus mucilaginosus TaxID=61624 RepID=H6NKS1_9BACL|nr:Dabb family protein [Paenibacillus mucilaginosus]AFC33208.1 Stress responsive alpha-beta barrel domain-containing protein [Paenibacillus mucilaginosus 3016]AFH65518.2 stress protein [Paenibacillus mucilaginosus K02]WFA21640.1 Dabb family protein [Paenibacillus mucilaginosus]